MLSRLLLLSLGLSRRCYAFTQYTLENLSIDAIADHTQMFQDLSPESRSVGTTSYNDTVEYVRQMLENSGYTTSLNCFQARECKFGDNSTLAAVYGDYDTTGTISTSSKKEYKEESDFTVFTYSGSGFATALGEAVPSLGCDASNFSDFTTGNVAIISRGVCTFDTKATLARDAGAVGIVIFQPPEREQDDLMRGTLGDEIEPFPIPTFFTTFNTSQELVGEYVSMFANVTKRKLHDCNVMAETQGDDKVIIVGSHLDSVPAGAGINDNGSGSAALLEIAIQMASVPTSHKVRFAWFGAEEIGLKGSRAYVESLTEEDAKNIVMYLNMDMIGSPNFARFLMNDQTVPGDMNITAAFEEYFHHKNLTTESMPPHGGCRSDHCFFQKVGIPTGGIFTGAEGNKTEDQALKFGGQAGAPYDPCYHQACDTIKNVNFPVLEENAHAYAHVLLTFANMDTFEFPPLPEVVEQTEDISFGGGIDILNSEWEGDYLVM